MSKSRQLRLGAFMRPVGVHTGARLCAKNVALLRPENRFFPRDV